MRTPHRFPLIAAGVAAAAGLAVLAGVSAAVDKPYTATLTVSSTPKGSAPTLSLAIRNGAAPQVLGSANVVVPPGVVIPAGSFPRTVAGTASGTASLSNGVIQLRNLALPPGGTATVAIPVRIPCSAPAAYTWDISVKQSNDFNGTGNDFTGNDPALATTGTCTASFTRQPADAERTILTAPQRLVPVTSVDGDPAGAPIQVTVRDGAGSPITWWNQAVTLSVATGPAGGLDLTAGSTVSASTGGTGVATFTPGPRLTISSGYTLRATSGGAATGTVTTTSDPFSIVDDFAICAAGQTCEAKTSNGAGAASLSTTGSNTGDVLSLSLDPVGAPAVDCPNYSETSGIVEFRYLSIGLTPGVMRLAFTINGALTRRTLKSFQFCMLKPPTERQFRDRSGNLTRLGLLPDCPRAPVPVTATPCLELREKDKPRPWDVTLTILTPQDDPLGRG